MINIDQQWTNNKYKDITKNKNLIKLDKVFYVINIKTIIYLPVASGVVSLEVVCPLTRSLTYSLISVFSRLVSM